MPSHTDCLSDCCPAAVLAPEAFQTPVEPEAPPAPGVDVERRREGRRLAPGELDTGGSQWAHRQKELLSRRLYLKDFWYAAGGQKLPLGPPVSC